MPLPSGEKLGPYEILSLIGVGGMGEVYRARDSRLNRDVAIKVSQAEFSDRFEREARAIAALNHPNVCTLYDVGPNYLVMEYIEGAPLKCPLSVHKALEYAEQIASALDAAHSKGITHRDLKPANILVTASGTKLLDFGLALVTCGPVSADETTAVGVTKAGTILGTAAYMSPEQAEAKLVDARSDIFSFGLVLYEMLSGRPAFTGDSTIAVMAAIVRDEPESLGAPPALQSIVTRCLRKSPRERFQSMAQVKEALLAATSGMSSPSAGVSERQLSIAVLPFANMSRDADDEYFSEGLAEEIINLLAQIPGLKVTARTSAFAFKGKTEDIRKIADTLGAATILEGSVRRSGSRLRVTAQLINAQDGYHLWSQRYDREMADLFDLQEEIAQSIASALKVKLSGTPAPQYKPSMPPHEALHVFITGSTAGLGRLAAQLLIEQGHSVVLHARNQQRGLEVLSAVPGAQTVVVGDLTSITQTRNVAEQLNALGSFDAVIHNAAIGREEPRRIATKDGLPHVFAVNTLAPYILTGLIRRPKRLVYLSSGLHQSGDTSLKDLLWEQRPWDGRQAYSDSKLHDVLLAFAVARLWPDVLSNALDPGWVATKMGGSGPTSHFRVTSEARGLQR